MHKNVPFFYSPGMTGDERSVTLDEATSRHIVQVLRMKAGEKIRLTNGKGLAADTEITDPHKKAAEVALLSTSLEAKKLRKAGIAISPVKNNSRYEWFLEKATELGISDIFPLVCSRTEKAHFRYDRMNAICISAMLQSQQHWLPVLHQPVAFADLVRQKIAGTDPSYQNRWIAHCTDEEKMPLSAAIEKEMNDGLILVGPEGDFTKEEIALAREKNFRPVALGETRLRTETAGVVAASLLMLC